MANSLSPEQEGQLLKALIEAKFGKRKNAEFCRLHGINGGPPYDSTKHGLVVLASLAYVGTRAFKLPE